MRILPRSLTGRLVATALIATSLALAFAALSIGHVLGHFVTNGLDQRLDAQISVVARAVRPDGSLDGSRAADVPPFDQPGSGWAWQVIAPHGTLHSRSLGTADLQLPPGWGGPPPAPRHRHREPGGDTMLLRPIDGFDAGGRPLHGRMAIVRTVAGDAQVIATAPREIVDQPLREAVAPLLLSLLLLAAFLLVAIIVQLRFGLRPLQRLGVMVEEVRSGRLRQLSVTEPTELLPLVAELNALIATNEQALAQARGHVANLAHGLKTPLATLRLDLEAGGAADARLIELVDRIDRQIRHHLGRARAAEMGDTAARSIALSQPVRDLVSAIGRIHAERAVRASIDIGPELRVRCDPQDLDELVGNILDNAWRHARSTIAITGVGNGRTVMLSIKDDGPGMTAAEISEAMIKGRRLDEREPGHGFGLAISGELAELHGGAVHIANAGNPAAGGLVVTIELPAA